MKVTVTTMADAIFSLDVSEDLELENFKAFCEVESGIPASQILVVLEGRPLTDDKKSLKELGIKDGDIVILQHHRGPNQNQNQASSLQGYGFNVPTRAPTAGLPQLDFSGIQVPGASSAPQSSTGSNQKRPPTEDDPAYIRDVLLSDPEQLALVKQNNPELAEALLSGNFDKFSKMIKEMQKRREEKEKLKQRLLNADEFDLEAQRLIADEIRQKNIDANMEAAMEFNPESFGTVVMLYIDCKVNGHPVKAFIDSGCQTTIMSTDCAERCNIMRLVDSRFSGIAKGVGTQRIIGRVHMGQIQIGDIFLTSSFSILEDQKTDMLFGLDMLRRHQCVIDLKRNVLVIGTTGTETRFLSESELPDSARLTSNNSEAVKENEAALSALGGEDVGLAKAIEESVRDQRKNKGGSPLNDSVENKKPRTE
ncbi:Protein DDI1 2 [Orchesella cincta]|uniref:Protein DDI1 2 n=1 Tax=Orchesella cincta TaxID=48709 RepID=A0A1D2MKG7_ORCCI|nr:Protein DDI1 2 [Orchesella cincta]